MFKQDTSQAGSSGETSSEVSRPSSEESNGSAGRRQNFGSLRASCQSTKTRYLYSNEILLLASR